MRMNFFGWYLISFHAIFMCELHWGAQGVGPPLYVPDSDVQLYHGSFDRCATSSHEIAEEVRLRDRAHIDTVRKTRAGTRWSPPAPYSRVSRRCGRLALSRS